MITPEEADHAVAPDSKPGLSSRLPDGGGGGGGVEPPPSSEWSSRFGEPVPAPLTTLVVAPFTMAEETVLGAALGLP